MHGICNICSIFSSYFIDVPSGWVARLERLACGGLPGWACAGLAGLADLAALAGLAGVARLAGAGDGRLRGGGP